MHRYAAGSCSYMLLMWPLSEEPYMQERFDGILTRMEGPALYTSGENVTYTLNLFFSFLEQSLCVAISKGFNGRKGL